MGSVSETENKKILLFTGHMIDAPDRQEPRFPKKRESEIRQKIKNKVEGILKTSLSNNSYIGISGAACGGDLLFLEICKELGLHIKMMLALPPEKFIAESIAFAGNSWVDRFYTIHEDANTEVLIMAEAKDVPKASKQKDGHSFWERNNLWLLSSALDYGGNNVVLIAVWDGKGANGPGGTKHMIEEVQKKGARSIIIPLK